MVNLLHTIPPAETIRPGAIGVTRLAWTALAINIVVILWGAVVRATGSGAGCGSHWPLCNGEVIPPSPSIGTLIEFSHRLSSGATLLVTAALVWSVWKVFPRGHRARLGAALCAVTMIVESLLGAGLVLLRLVAENQSIARGWWVGAHLVNTLLLLGAFTMTAVWVSGTGVPALPRSPGHALRLAAVGAALLCVIVTGASGAITALGDTLFPPETLAIGLAQKDDPEAHPFVRLRLWHPTFAIATTIALAVSGPALATASASRRASRLASVVTLLCLAQLGVGVLNVLLLAPVAMQLVHLAIADLIWISAVWMTLEAMAGFAHPVPETEEPETGQTLRQEVPALSRSR